MLDITMQLLLQVFLIILNAFFAATEIAVISLNEKKVKSLAESGDKKAKKMLKMIDNPTKFLSTIQIGITLAGFLGSAFAADNFADRLTGLVVNSFNISSQFVGIINTVSVIVITLILSYFTLVFGEIVPKRIAMKHKEILASKVAGFITVLTIILKPIVWFLTVSTNGILRLFKIDPNQKGDAVSEDDIVLMLDAGADEGTLDDGNVKYIKNVFRLDRLSAVDVMTPRLSLVAMPVTASNEQITETIKNDGYSRIPLYSNTVDQIVGILHSRDFLLKRDDKDFSIEQAMLSPTFVPETILLDVLIKKMQAEHVHMVIVIDEYGITTGIVTMEDILEELVGEIWDEQDDEVNSIVAIDDTTFDVQASIPVEKFFDFFKLETDKDIESTTLNGWLNELSNTIPTLNFEIEYNDLKMQITKMNGMQAEIVRVKKLSNNQEDMQISDSENQEIEK